MSEIIKGHANKETTFAGRIVNSNTVTTALTCAICMVIFAVCFRLTSDGGGGGGYDPSDIQYSYRGYRKIHVHHRVEKAWTRSAMVDDTVACEAYTVSYR